MSDQNHFNIISISYIKYITINISRILITRLLGRPQPQMYPPVALNQYTLVNRTHKHHIYMLQGPTNILKSHQSSTICMLNPEVLKCHEDLITLDTYVQQGKTMDNKFYI